MLMLRLILVALAVALIGVLGWKLSSGGTQQAVKNAPTKVSLAPTPDSTGKPVNQLTPNQKLAATRQLITRRLAEVPEYKPFFELLKKSFPKAHNRIVEGFVDKAQKGGRIESADLYLAQALSGLRSTHGVLAAKAGPAHLSRIFSIQSSIVKTLAKSNAKLCADYLNGSASRSFFKFSTAHRKIMGDMAHAGLVAIVDGQNSKIERASPNEDDFKLIEVALKNKGLEKPEIEALLDGKTPDPPLADKTICKAGQIYFDTLRNLPEDLRMKIYALQIKLLARS